MESTQGEPPAQLAMIAETPASSIVDIQEERENPQFPFYADRAGVEYPLRESTPSLSTTLPQAENPSTVAENPRTSVTNPTQSTTPTTNASAAKTTTTGPTPTTPTSVPGTQQPLPSGSAIPVSRFDALVDPNTWAGANRDSGQLIVAGDRFNPGETVGNLGYGLSFSGNDVHSFSMDDGSTLRWGVRSAEGIPGLSIVSAVQWMTNDGYDPEAQIGPRNASVPTPPNDPLYHDGTRNQVTFTGNPVRSGANADRVLMGTLFQVPDWAPVAQDNKAAIMTIHAPDIAPLSSPVSTAIDHGRFRIIGRTSTSNRPTNSTSDNFVLFDERIPDSAVGQWWALAYEVKLSPSEQDDPFVRIWLRRGTNAQWELITDRDGPIGYVYDGYASSESNASHLNGSNYPILARYYSYHRWGNDFDVNYPVRRIEFGFSGAIIGNEFTAAELLQTLDDFAGVN